MCNHPTNALLGTAEGIVCRVCGRKFTTFAEIHENAEAPAKAKAEAAEKKAATAKRGRTKKNTIAL